MTDGPRPRSGGSQRGPQPDPVRRPAPGVTDLRTRLQSGFGSPEGVVYAGTGAVYQDTDPAGSGAIWKKTTSSGNTGWQELGGGGAGGGVPPYAIQLKRHTGINLTIPHDTDTPIDFSAVYFENNGGVMFPADGGTWPPAPADSMFTAANPLVLTAPVAGLWGFRAAYAYAAMPLGSFYRTRVDHNNSTVANAYHGREATQTGTTFAGCEIVGTARMSAGDYLEVWALQQSGVARSVRDIVTFNDDEPGTGPLFAMWLIAPDT